MCPPFPTHAFPQIMQPAAPVVYMHLNATSVVAPATLAADALNYTCAGGDCNATWLVSGGAGPHPRLAGVGDANLLPAALPAAGKQAGT